MKMELSDAFVMDEEFGFANLKSKFPKHDPGLEEVKRIFSDYTMRADDIIAIEHRKPEFLLDSVYYVTTDYAIAAVYKEPLYEKGESNE